MNRLDAPAIETRRLGVKLFAGLAFMAVFLWLAFRQIRLKELAGVFEHLRPVPVLVAIAFQAAAFYLRAWRWQLLLRASRPRPRRGRTLAALLVGYAVNDFLPRAGEVVRVVILRRLSGVSVSAGLSSVLNERLMDVVTLALLFPVTLLVYRERFEAVFPGVGKGVLTAAVAAIGGLVVTWMLSRDPERSSALLRRLVRRFLPSREGAISQQGTNFLSGLSGLFHRQSAPALFALSAGIWACYVLSNWTMLAALPYPDLARLDLADGLAITLVVAIAFALPSPGGAGTTHYFASRFLTGLYAVRPAEALAYATLLHAASFIPTVLAGAACFLFVPRRDGAGD